MAITNKVVIVPARATSYATILRANINEVLGHARLGEIPEMKAALASARRNLTKLETEVLVNHEED